MPTRLPEGADRFLWTELPLRERKTAFEESQVVRSKEKGHEGEFAQKMGVSSTPALAAQAKTGIEKIGALLPEALVEMGKFTVATTLWSKTPHAIQEKIADIYAESQMSVKAKDSPLTAKDFKEMFHHLPEYAKEQHHTAAILTGKLPKEDIIAPEPPKWVTGVTHGDSGEIDYKQTNAVASKLVEMRMDQIRAERGIGVHRPTFTIHEVTEHEGKPLSKPMYEVHNQLGEAVDFSGTKEKAEKLKEMWENDNTTGLQSRHIVQGIWESWKNSSSASYSRALQLAAAEELGGNHRLTYEEIGEAKQAALEELGPDGMPLLKAYVRAQWETTQYVMHRAGEDKVEVYRGLMLPGEHVRDAQHEFLNSRGEPIPPPSNIKPVESDDTGRMVKFDYNGDTLVVERRMMTPHGPGMGWSALKDEVKQQVFDLWMADASEANVEGVTPERAKELAKGIFERIGDSAKFDIMHGLAKQGRVFPAYQYALEAEEHAIQRRINAYMQEYGGNLIFDKLPQIVLQRAGLQSTTGTRSVANNWQGVDVYLIDDPERVVLRMVTPPTSVLSVPVFGKNVQGEHEVVLIGTKDRWMWDAWHERAPGFESQTVKKRDYETVGD